MISDLNAYRVFFSIARHNSISRAAAELCISQPTATRILHGLEVQLDCQLFLRSAKGTVLTREGELLYSRLAPILQQFDNMEGELQTLRHGKSSIIQVATNVHSSEFMISRMLTQFSSAHPDISVYVNKMPVESAMAAYSAGWIDLIFIYSVAEPFRLFDTGIQKLYGDQDYKRVSLGRITDRFIIGPRLHDEYSGDNIGKIPLILPSIMFDNTKYYLSKLRKDSCLAQNDILIDDTKSRLWLTMYDHGMSYFPTALLSDELSDGKLYTIDTDIQMCSYNSAFFYKDGLSLDERFDELIQSAALYYKTHTG